MINDKTNAPVAVPDERAAFEIWWSTPHLWSHGHKEAQWAAWQARAALAATPAGVCNHRIVDARNQVVKSGYLCVDCGAVFSAYDHVATPTATAQVPAVDTETIHLQDLKNAIADCNELRQQLTLMDELLAGSVWRWQADGQDQLETMGNNMGVLIRACDLCDLLDGGVSMETSPPVPKTCAAHSDDVAVDRFADEMKAKLAAARAKGRDGWETLPPEVLSSMLREHVGKGDPRDVANFCMFLWCLGQPITAAPYKLPYPDLWRDESGLRGYNKDPGQGPWYTADTVRKLVESLLTPTEPTIVTDVN